MAVPRLTRRGRETTSAPVGAHEYVLVPRGERCGNGVMVERLQRLAVRAPAPLAVRARQLRPRPDVVRLGGDLRAARGAALGAVVGHSPTVIRLVVRDHGAPCSRPLSSVNVHMVASPS